MPPWCRRAPDGTLVVAVHAQPGAKRTALAGVHGDALRIRVAAPPVDDRANEALVEFLAQLFQVKAREVSLVSGRTSRQKRFEVRGSAVAPESVAG